MKLNPYRPLRLALFPALLIALVACSGAPVQPTPEAVAPTVEAAAPTVAADGPVEVRIKMTEFVIESSMTTFQTGVPYRFIMESAGELAHDFRITPRGESQSMIGMQADGHAHEHGNEILIVREPDLQPGAAYTADITFEQPGEFEFACHVAGHLEAGMLLPIEVTGEVVSMPTAIAPESITYDAKLMPEMPCHAMGLTIAGKCTPEDVERVRAEILAKDAAMLAKLGGGKMDMGDMMADGTMDMDKMMASGMMDKMMAGGMMDKMATGRIIIDRVTRKDEACQIVDDRTILGACSVEDIARLVGELMARVDAEAATAASAQPEGEPAATADHDHDHEPEATPTTGG